MVAAGPFAFLRIRQGLAPKILALHPAEIELSIATGIPEFLAPSFLGILGAAEAIFGLAFPFFARRRWPWLPTIISMAVGLFVTQAAVSESR